MRLLEGRVAWSARRVLCAGRGRGVRRGVAGRAAGRRARPAERLYHREPEEADRHALVEDLHSGARHDGIDNPEDAEATRA